VLTQVLAGRTRHRSCRTHGATLTRAAKPPRVAAAVGASTRLVAQPFFPAIQPRPAGATIPSSQPGQSPTTVALLADARPSHHLPIPPLVDRAAPSGVVPGKLGNAAVLGASSGFAEGAHHRSGADGAASAIASQHHHAWIVPPPKQGKRCSASPSPPVGSLWSRRVGCRLPGSSTRVVLVDTVGLGWLGVARSARAPGLTRGRLPGRPRRFQARRRRCQRALMSAQRWLDKDGPAGTRPASLDRRAGRRVPGSRRART
jgi:hypothetical protein